MKYKQEYEQINLS